MENKLININDKNNNNTNSKYIDKLIKLDVININIYNFII